MESRNTLSWWYVMLVCHGGMSWWYVMMVCHDCMSWWYVMMLCHDGMSRWYVMIVCHDGMLWLYVMVVCHDGMPWWYVMVVCHDVFALLLDPLLSGFGAMRNQSTWDYARNAAQPIGARIRRRDPLQRHQVLGIMQETPPSQSAPGSVGETPCRGTKY